MSIIFPMILGPGFLQQQVSSHAYNAPLTLLANQGRAISAETQSWENLPFCRIAVKCSPNSCFSTQAISGFLGSKQRRVRKEVQGRACRLWRTGTPVHAAEPKSAHAQPSPTPTQTQVTRAPGEADSGGREAPSPTAPGDDPGGLPATLPCPGPTDGLLHPQLPLCPHFFLPVFPQDHSSKSDFSERPRECPAGHIAATPPPSALLAQLFF